MQVYENPTLNAKVGEIVAKTDGRNAEIITTMKVSVMIVDGKIELNASIDNNGKKWNGDKRQQELIQYWERINNIFQLN